PVASPVADQKLTAPAFAPEPDPLPRTASRRGSEGPAAARDADATPASLSEFVKQSEQRIGRAVSDGATEGLRRAARGGRGAGGEGRVGGRGRRRGDEPDPGDETRRVGDERRRGQGPDRRGPGPRQRRGRVPQAAEDGPRRRHRAGGGTAADPGLSREPPRP